MPGQVPERLPPYSQALDMLNILLWTNALAYLFGASVTEKEGVEQRFRQILETPQTSQLHHLQRLLPEGAHSMGKCRPKRRQCAPDFYSIDI